MLENKKKELEFILPEFVLGKYKGFEYQGCVYIYHGKIGFNTNFNTNITFYRFVSSIVSNDFTIFCHDGVIKEIYKQPSSFELTDLDLKYTKINLAVFKNFRNTNSKTSVRSITVNDFISKKYNSN